MNTYIVEGGVGKHIAFTSVLPKLAQQNGGQVQIYTPYVDIFAYNPLVKLAIDQNTLPINDERILQSKNIIYVEPYKSNFIKGDIHLVDSYCQLLGIEYDVSMKSKIYTDTYEKDAKPWLESKGVTGDYIMVQFTGGQTPIGYSPGNQYVSNNTDKNYPYYFADHIIKSLKRIYPDTAILDCTLSNEPGFVDAIKCDIHWTGVHELLKNAAGFISIDSCLNHMSASAETQGVVIWGNTRWTQFGYMHNKNVTFHQKKRFNSYFKTDVMDPRNILVDPDHIVDVYVNDVHNKKIKTSSIKCAHKT